ncbi:NAD-dependent epimerase/dehydratase family protein [Streptomyces sp. WAC 00631]|uniref:NAD-dependent epimerase/dehydratase family protein n=1 Tax=Streptomyces sp. WAC 00631 TaxID=2203201 RepID=UPI000F797ECD|nr:NAD-dependent epimerase/dehydratase family protein [Streptomyces sp. WAC 00631]MCC5036675.1 NAD-dependent epimerase/dehydratase family protein [Streptomyces sp. WAC 00631]
MSSVPHGGSDGTGTTGTGGKGGDGAGGGLRVVVVGATGNVGTSVVRALSEDPAVGSVLGLARRMPGWSPPRTRWAAVDIGEDAALGDLTRHFRGADAVVHLAWLFQPTHTPALTWRTNVLGSLRVFEAAAAAGVPALVYASSVGAYSAGPKDRPVDESWPTHGWPEAAYCREKSYIERALDVHEREHPHMRVVRMRPGFLFKPEAASQQRRLFAGPLLSRRMARPDLLPVVPDLPGLRFQALHTDDAAEAYRLAVTSPAAHGAYNLAADPPVDAPMLAELFGARVVRMPAWPVRSGLAAAWRLHLVPASPQLFDAVLRLPLMDTRRAVEELGWRPRYTAREALMAFVDGLREERGMDTAPLASSLPGGGRAAEVATGVGERP